MIKQEYTVQDLKDAELTLDVNRERDLCAQYKGIPASEVSDRDAVKCYQEHSLVGSDISPDDPDYDEFICKATDEMLQRYQYGKKLLETLKVAYSEASICLSNEHLRELAERETLVSPALAYSCGWVANKELHYWKALALR